MIFKMCQGSHSASCWHKLDKCFAVFILLLSLGQVRYSLGQRQECRSIDLVDLAAYGVFRSLDVGEQTCGVPLAEQYQSLDTSVTDILTCDPAAPAQFFPPTGLTDKLQPSPCVVNPNFDTFWKTKNTVTTAGGIPFEITMVVNFTDRFQIDTIRLVFGNFGTTHDGRPTALVYEKYDAAATPPGWVPLRYEAENCAMWFPGIPISGSGVTAFCSTRPQGSAPFVMDFSPSVNPEFDTNPDVRNFYTTSAIRVRLTRPSSTELLRSHYDVNDIGVDGTCPCFSHSSACLGPNAAGCECTDNTAGANCELCLPLYNNKAWQIGPNFQCELCECNEYATACEFDAIKGYGVCIACEENTSGDFCDTCATGYYRNPSNQNPRRNATGLLPGTCTGFNGTTVVSYPCNSWCIPCDCHVNGTVNGDSTCDAAGQCQCKLNVMGRRCDQCKDTFWDLLAEDVNGCKACICSPSGTQNNTNVCNKETGLCPCKDNTEGDGCGTCKPRTFNLDVNNPAGCTPCDCDPGGAVSPVCNVVGGQCQCRDGLGGRDCRTPNPLMYLPKLDHFLFEAEFQTPLSGPVVTRSGHGTEGATVSGTGFVQLGPNQAISFTTSVLATQLYNVVIRYESAFTWPGVQVTMVMDGGAPYVCDGQDFAAGQQFSGSVQIQTAPSAGAVTTVAACLSAGETYTVTVTLANDLAANPGAQILIDSVVLLPDITKLQMYTLVDQALAMSCYEATKSVQGSLGVDPLCPSLGYSAMAELLNGAVQCSCLSTGVEPGTTCNPLGGQCVCKPGVMLQGCTLCKVYHIDGDIANGCTACDCDPNGSEVLSCDVAGACTCKTNVIGVKCNACDVDHYGLSTGNGCQPCACHPDYSLNNACADNGQCVCKPGVSGTACDVCTDGWFNLTTGGCTSCGCHPDGSTPAACSKATGVCECKGQVTGNTCNECKAAHYGLGPWHPDGCLACLCSTHSTNCTSAAGFYDTLAQSVWLLSPASTVDTRWLGSDENGGVVFVDNPTVFFTGQSVAQYVMQIKNSPEYLKPQALYFLAPPEYLGDKRSSYGRSLSFRLSQSSQDAPLVDTLGDVILKGVALSYSLVTKLSAMPGPGPTDYTITLQENEWKLDNTDGATGTSLQLLETLSSLEAIMIRGKYDNTTDSIVNLYSASLQYSSRDNSSGIPVNNVEMCTCPERYTGQFCELCAPNYRRSVATPGSFGTCEPCQCNGHSLDTCDGQTGKCTCTHNTGGDQCDVCLPGFYGNALQGTPNDCSPCMCPGNVVEGAVNAFASTCDNLGKCIDCAFGHQGDRCEACIQDYYGMPTNISSNGGQCVACFCNGRADTCDPISGVCVNCRNNTTGKECDICAQPYFGDAMSNSCQRCTCDTIGTTGECDPATGDCFCKPNVIGPTCDQCDVNSYDYDSGNGCSLCDCHELGSFGPSCNVTTGQCACKAQVIGRRCDACEDTFYEVSNIGCKACDCVVEGTANVTGQTFGTCDLMSGQCTCAIPGILGRTCDVCSKVSKLEFTYVNTFYIGVYPDCVLCGECFDSWATKIDEVGFAINNLNVQIYQIWNNYDNLQAADVALTISRTQTDLITAQQGVLDIRGFMTTLSDLEAGYNGVKTQVDGMNLNLDNLDSTKSLRQAELDSLKQFDGSVIAASGATKSLLQLQSDIDSQKTTQESQFSRGSAAFTELADMVQLVKTSDAQVAGLRQRVGTAKTDISSATTNRNSARNLIGAPFQAAFQTNQGSLQNIISTLDDISTVQTMATANIASAEERVTTCNTTLGFAQTLIIQKSSSVATVLEQSQIANRNASDAATLTNSAENQVNNFRNIASSAKSSLTTAVTTLAEGQQLVVLANTNVASANQFAADIQAISIRPLSEMQAITSNIRGATVPPADVSAAVLEANNALVTAGEAETITAEAVSQSRLAQQELETIRTNLDQSAVLRESTQALVTEADNTEATILGVIDAVNTKASTSRQKALDTEGRVNSLSVDIANVGSCVTTATNDANAALQVALEAESVQKSADQQHTVNTDLVANISVVLNEQKSRPGYALAVEANNAIDSLTADLATVGDVTELQTILNALIGQQNTITSLETEIAQMEASIEAIITNLEKLNPANTFCATN